MSHDQSGQVCQTPEGSATGELGNKKFFEPIPITVGLSRDGFLGRYDIGQYNYFISQYNDT